MLPGFSPSPHVGADQDLTGGVRARIFWQSIVLVLTVFVICLIYFAAASKGGTTFFALSHGDEYYPMLTDAFLAGKPYLLVPPRPELLALPDPRDPAANAPYRLHDLALYNGRYYMYYGPAPAITLFLPFKVLTGKDLPTSLAATVFCLAGFLFSAALFFALAEKSGLHPPGWFCVVALVTLGLCQFVPFLLSRPIVYETAIAAGYCFLMGGLLFFFRAVTENRHATWQPLVAGVFLALATASRPNYAPSVLTLAFCYLIFLWSRSRMIGQVIRNDSFYLFVGPMIVAAMAMGWYNFIRFGSPFEFGIRYMLSAVNPAPVPTMRLGSLALSLYYFLLAPPVFQRGFPFVTLLLSRPSPFGELPHYFMLAGSAGLLAVTPLSLGIIWAPLVKRTAQVRFMVLALSFTSLVTLLVIASLGWVAPRYMLDFVPAILVLALLGLGSALAFTKGYFRMGVSAIIWAAVAWSTALNLLFVLGYYVIAPDTRKVSPRSADTLRKVATFLDSSLYGPQAGTRIYPTAAWYFKGTIRFPEPESDAAQSILWAGTSSGSNRIRVMYSRTQATFIYDQSSGQIAKGMPVGISAGKDYAIELRFDPGSSNLLISIDGAPVFDQQIHPLPVDPDRLLIGMDRDSSGRVTAGFSGRLEVQACDLMPPGYLPIAFTSTEPFSRGISENIVAIPDRLPFSSLVRPGTGVVLWVSGPRKVVGVRESQGLLQLTLDRPANNFDDGWPRAIKLTHE